MTEIFKELGFIVVSDLTTKIFFPRIQTEVRIAGSREAFLTFAHQQIRPDPAGGEGKLGTLCRYYNGYSCGGCKYRHDAFPIPGIFSLMYDASYQCVKFLEDGESLDDQIKRAADIPAESRLNLHQVKEKMENARIKGGYDTVSGWANIDTNWDYLFVQQFKFEKGGQTIYIPVDDPILSDTNECHFDKDNKNRVYFEHVDFWNNSFDIVHHDIKLETAS